MANKKTETITTEDLRKLITESGLTVAQIEKGVGMPSTTLDKVLRAKPDSRGYTRTLPTKYVADTIQFIKEKKIAKEELILEVKEVLVEHNIEVKEPEVFIPDEKRKLDWISKLQEVKASIS